MKALILLSIFAALTASAKVVYVTPTGAGTKDGTSWANASASVGAAYAGAADGATAEAPGEVWIAKGFYNVAGFGIITMKPHVRVYGGFTGDETSVAEADPENNWSILCENHYAANPDKYYWIDENNVKQCDMWTYANGTWTYNPIPEGVYWRGSDCGNSAMFADAGSDGTDNEFHGIVFTGCSKGGAIELTAGGASVKVCNCRFLGNSAYTGNDHSSVFTSGKATLLVDSCYFEGCNTSLRFLATTADSAVTVTNCSFVSCYAKSGTAAGVSTAGEGLVKVLGCSFERSWFNSNQPAMDLYLTGRNTLVRDCTFKDSRSFSDTFNGVSIGVGANNITVDVERCSITGVRTAVKGDSYSAGACLKDFAAISGSNVRIRDSYFANNFISCKDGSNGNRAYGCVYGMQSGNRHSFVNCTFEGNRIVKTNTSSHVSMITGGYNNYWATLVNCVFKDNDCYKVSDGSVTNRIAEIDYGGWGYFYMVNTIMTHSAADYVPFVNTKPVFVADCVKNLTYPAGSIAPSLTGDPKLAAAPITQDGVIAWGLECGSPCRKGGYLVWEGTDRQLYFRDPTAAAATPWRSLTNKGLVTDEAAAAVGVSLAAKPLPDAFGATWKEKWVALGPLPAPVSGLSVLVR